MQRTFFHSDWVLPIAISVAVYFIGGLLVNLSIGFMIFQMYVIEEKLEWPTMAIAADACITLSEGRDKRVGVFSMGSLAGLLHGFVAYFLPFVFGFSLIPVPWIDLNSTIEKIFPGASLGIATDLTVLATGWILPFNVAVSMFIGSFSTWFIGNNMLVNAGLFRDWTEGLSLQTVWQRSVLSFWLQPQIGMAIPVALMPLILNPTILIRTFRGLSGRSASLKRRGLPSMKLIAPMYISGCAAMFAVNALLTEFPPLYVALITFGWNFILTMVSARALAETGTTIGIPHATALFYTFSGYKGVDVWFAPMDTYFGGGTNWCSHFKLADLTQTKITSFVKADILGSVLAWIASFIFMQIFWSIASIPSTLYRAVDIFWPTNVIQKGMWVSGQLITETSVTPLLGSMAIGVILGVVPRLSFIPIISQINPISIVAGMMAPIPGSVTLLIGALLGKFVFERKFGTESWKKSKVSLAAGVFLGESIMITLGVALMMIPKALWTTPY